MIRSLDNKCMIKHVSISGVTHRWGTLPHAQTHKMVTFLVPSDVRIPFIVTLILINNFDINSIFDSDILLIIIIVLRSFYGVIHLQNLYFLKWGLCFDKFCFQHFIF